MQYMTGSAIDSAFPDGSPPGYTREQVFFVFGLGVGVVKVNIHARDMNFSRFSLIFSNLQVDIITLGLWSALQSMDIHFQNHLGMNFVDFQAGVSKPSLVQAQALLFLSLRQMFFF
jgi:hypothetical protein